MSDNVIPLGCITRLDLPADTVLEGAKGKLSSVVLLGWTEDGDEYFASTDPDGGNVLWRLERAKHRLLQMPEEFDDGGSA